MSYERTLRTEIVRLRRLLRRCHPVLTYERPHGAGIKLADDVGMAIKRPMPPPPSPNDLIAARDTEWRDAIGDKLFGPHTPAEAKVFKIEGQKVDAEIEANKVTAAERKAMEQALEITEGYEGAGNCDGSCARSIRADIGEYPS